MKGQKWLISCIKKYRKNIAISSGIAIFSDVSKRCNILLSRYIAIQNAQPCSGHWHWTSLPSGRMTCIRSNPFYWIPNVQLQNRSLCFSMSHSPSWGSSISLRRSVVTDTGLDTMSHQWQGALQAHCPELAIAHFSIGSKTAVIN